MKELLAALEGALAGCDAGSRANVERDLAAVLARLRAGEYAVTDFAARNTFDVPRRTREFSIYLAGWARHARTWAAVLGALPLERVRRAVDLCPGWAPKIELALATLGWRGTLELVDRDAEAAQQVAELAAILDAPFTLELHVEDLFSAPARPAELAVANHVVDDLLLARFAGPRVYEDEAALAAAFAELTRRRDEVLDHFAPELARALAARVSPGGFLALTHYPSYVESVVALGPGAEVPRVVFTRTTALLREAGFADVPAPLEALRALGDRATFAPEHAAVLMRATNPAARR